MPSTLVQHDLALEPVSEDAVTETVSAHARVLVVLGSIPLYGKERGNIEVFRALQAVPSVDPLFVTHRDYGHENIQPELDRQGLAWTVGTFPGFWSMRMGLRAWGRRLREFAAGNADLVSIARAHRATHVHVPAERMMSNLLPALWWLRLPVVFRLGDLPRRHRWPFRVLWRALLIPTTTTFVCISEFVRAQLLVAGAPHERVRVIRNVPPTRSEVVRDLPPDLEAERRGGARPYRGRTVAYTGQITADKGVDLFVEAALKLCVSRPDVRFLLAGGYAWQNPFANALLARVEAAGMSDRVRFLGFVHDVGGLLDLADVHVAPSVWEEPLGNVVQEAKRAGVPSVVFPSGGLPELILRPGFDGVVCEERTADALVDGIVYYLDMEAVRLVETGTAARASLDALGLTPEAFTAAWARVFADATR